MFFLVLEIPRSYGICKQESLTMTCVLKFILTTPLIAWIKAKTAARKWVEDNVLRYYPETMTLVLSVFIIVPAVSFE